MVVSKSGVKIQKLRKMQSSIKLSAKLLKIKAYKKPQTEV